MIPKYINSETGEKSTKPSYEHGRAQHTNSVTGLPGAMSSEDGRSQHTNSVTGLPGAMIYEDGRAAKGDRIVGVRETPSGTWVRRQSVIIFVLPGDYYLTT